MKTLALVMLLLALAVTAQAEDVTLVWDPNVEPDLAGYRVFQAPLTGTHSGAFTQIATVLAPAATYTVTGLPDNKNYIWYATAYDTGGQESHASNMVWRWKPGPGHPKNVEKQEP